MLRRVLRCEERPRREVVLSLVSQRTVIEANAELVLREGSYDQFTARSMQWSPALALGEIRPSQVVVFNDSMLVEHLAC